MEISVVHISGADQDRGRAAASDQAIPSYAVGPVRRRLVNKIGIGVLPTQYSHTVGTP